jgi:hypothetical protein
MLAARREAGQAPPYQGLGARLRTLIQQGLEAGVAGAADGETRTIRQDGEAAVFSIGLDTDHALKIHNVGTMDSDELFGVQAGFEAGDRLLLQVLFAFAGQGYVVILRFGVVEFSNRD